MRDCRFSLFGRIFTKAIFCLVATSSISASADLPWPPLGAVKEIADCCKVAICCDVIKNQPNSNYTDVELIVSSGRNGALVCGCGYPANSTRQLTDPANFMSKYKECKQQITPTELLRCEGNFFKQVPVM